MTHMIFCNTAWMRHFRGVTKQDQPIGGGGDGVKDGEVNNFRPFHGRLYGYVAAIGRIEGPPQGIESPWREQRKVTVVARDPRVARLGETTSGRNLRPLW